MRLSDLKVGMHVTHPELGHVHEVVKVGDGVVATVWTVHDSLRADTWQKLEGWQIFEPRKKPSETIRKRSEEIFQEWGGIKSQGASNFDAILAYLDECAERESK